MSGHPPGGVILPASVQLQAGNGGLPRLEISSRLATAQVYLHGGHIAAWRPSHASAPVLWLSAHSHFQTGKPIRGGVPICFPWFGPHPTDRSAPAHGFARLAPWSLTEARQSPDGTVVLALSLQGDGTQSPLWPHRFRATHRISIGARLTMALEVENPGEQPFTFEEALHTYFAVQEIERVTVAGLEGTTYLDKVERSSPGSQGHEPIAFTAETDRLYLDTSATCVIRDPGLQRRIIVSKSGSRTTVVWNPWIDKARAMPDFGDREWPAMLCVETANVDSAAVRLEPGATHTMTASIDVEPV